MHDLHHSHIAHVMYPQTRAANLFEFYFHFVYIGIKNDIEITIMLVVIC